MCEHILGGRDIYEWRQEAEAQQHYATRLRGALAFARGVIKSGEPWTDECERVIDGVLVGRKHKRVPVTRSTEDGE